MAFMYLTDDEIFHRIVAHVREEAAKMGIRGVFAMADITRATIRVAWVGTTHPIDQDADGRYNILAIVLAKIGMVMAYGKHTGNPTDIVGEVPYKGGRLSENKCFGYAFSGAAEEVDDQLMQKAEVFHKTL